MMKTNIRLTSEGAKNAEKSVARCNSDTAQKLGWKRAHPFGGQG
jgi:hypothetical protein